MTAEAAAADSGWTFIPDILQENLEELGYLWGRRQGALRSSEETALSVHSLEERIRARLQGVFAVARDGLPLIEQGLDGDDGDVVFASAYSLLHLGDEGATSRVLDAFAAASEEPQRPLTEALAHGPPTGALPRLWALLDSERAATAVAAAEILAFRGALRLTPDQVGRFLTDESPAVRRDGWRLVAYLNAAVEPAAYAATLRDEAATVRDAAMEAGAWCRVEGTLAFAREQARAPSPEQLRTYYLLAVLSTPQDLPLLRGIAEAVSLGPGRFDILAASGLPACVEWIIPELSNADPATAAAAGAAYTRLTGVDIKSDHLARVLPPGGAPADEFEAEFLEELALPDAERARRAWRELAPRLVNARLGRGLDVARPLTAEAFERLDMESRWELYLRSKFYGSWDGTPLNLEVFPH